MKTFAELLIIAAQNGVQVSFYLRHRHNPNKPDTHLCNSHLRVHKSWGSDRVILTHNDHLISEDGNMFGPLLDRYIKSFTLNGELITRDSPEDKPMFEVIGETEHGEPRYGKVKNV